MGFNEEIYDTREFGTKKKIIPIVGTITAGEPIFDEENIIGYAHKPPAPKLSEDVLNDVFYLKVKGDIMDLVYLEGSLVLIRRNIIIENGDDAVVLLPDQNEATLKKVKLEKIT